MSKATQEDIVITSLTTTIAMIILAPAAGLFSMAGNFFYVVVLAHIVYYI